MKLWPQSFWGPGSRKICAFLVLQFTWKNGSNAKLSPSDFLSHFRLKMILLFENNIQKN